MPQYTYLDIKNLMDNNGTAIGARTDGTPAYCPANTSLKSYGFLGSPAGWYSDETIVGDLFGCDPAGIDERHRKFRIANAPGAGGSGKGWTIYRRVNGIDVDSQTIMETATTCAFTTNLHLNAGDKYLLKAVGINTPAAMGLTWTSAKRRGNGQAMFVSWGGALQLSFGQDRIIGFPAGGAQPFGQYGEYRPFFASQVGYLYVKTNTAIAGADTLDITLYKLPVSGGRYSSANETATSVTVRLTNGATSANFTSALASFNDGDLIGIRGTFTNNSGGSTSPVRVFIGVQAFPANAGECWHCYEGFPGSARKGYGWSANDPILTAAESLCTGYSYAVNEIKKLRVIGRNSPTGLTNLSATGPKTGVVTVHKNLSATGMPTVTITGDGGAAMLGQDLVTIGSAADDDQLGFEFDLTNAGTSTPGFSTSFITTMTDDPPPVISNTSLPSLQTSLSIGCGFGP